VCQLGHGDGFGHVHFNNAGFNGRCLNMIFTVAIVATTVFRTTAPIVAAYTTAGVATRWDGFLFSSRIACPA
jgi:hypothetical protein